MKKQLLIICIAIILTPLCLQAASFNKNNILSDSELTNFTSMSKDRVESFLKSKNGVLANYKSKDIDGKNKSAGEIIYNACQKYLLSPKFMLVTLQKESSLITRKSASQKLIDQALGFGCPDGGGCSSKYSGFTHQVYSAADKIRNSYLADLEKKNATISGWGVGRAKRASDGLVTPANKATAVLYTYTPWIGYHGGANVGGNSLFFDIWDRWFGFSDAITYYPSGTLLQSKESGIVYLIKDGSKMAFTSLGALVANYNINKTITVKEEVLDQYTEGVQILFPNYTLLQSPQGAIFLYVDGQKRGITSQEIFRKLGYNPEEVLPASEKELNNIPSGPQVAEQDLYPGGILYQNNSNGAVVFIDEEKQRHPIWAKEILETRFRGVPVFSKDKEEIKKYEKSDPVKFRDGELVTSPSSDSVFVIDNGRKRPFKSKKAFDKLGYQWENIVQTSDKVLDLHPKGKEVTAKQKNNNKSTKKKKTKKKNKK